LSGGLKIIVDSFFQLRMKGLSYVGKFRSGHPVFYIKHLLGRKAKGYD